jgi:hypothetical protein
MLARRRRQSLGTKQVETLPKMGAVCAHWVRCGRPSCRCANGELHGPYHYLFWRDSGRLRKRYVKTADAADMRAEYAARQAQMRQDRATVQSGWQEWRKLAGSLREVERGT